MTGIYLSYRRESFKVVDHITDKLSKATLAGAIFVDRKEREASSELPAELAAELDSAHLVIAIIGPTWISLQDPVVFSRCLDLEKDIVRQELAYALRTGKKVLSVLIQGAATPQRFQLPEPLRDLAGKPSVNLSVEDLQADVDRLLREIGEQLGSDLLAEVAQDLSPGEKFPPVPVVVPEKLTEEMLGVVLRELPQWRLVESNLVDDARFPKGYQRQELVREFRFGSFLDAVNFMAFAASSIDIMDHHPRWENVFCTVTVHFSTWDIGHRPSDRDHRAAKNMERSYQSYIAGTD